MWFFWISISRARSYLQSLSGNFHFDLMIFTVAARGGGVIPDHVLVAQLVCDGRKSRAGAVKRFSLKDLAARSRCNRFHECVCFAVQLIEILSQLVRRTCQHTTAYSI